MLPPCTYQTLRVSRRGRPHRRRAAREPPRAVAVARVMRGEGFARRGAANLVLQLERVLLAHGARGSVGRDRRRGRGRGGARWGGRRGKLRVREPLWLRCATRG